MRTARPHLIITADDFGRDAECTLAIAQSLSERTITAASMMANGACFEQACVLVRKHDLADRIGVHFSLDEGPPLSREMRSFTGVDGQLCVHRSLRPLGRGLARA